MELFPVGMAALAVWLAASLRDGDAAFRVVVALLPFGMLAVLRLPIGGMTPLAAHIGAALTVALALLGLWARARPPGGAVDLTMPRAGVPLLLFAAYALFASLFLARWFDGEFLVFSFARDATGMRISHQFRIGLVPVGPVPANLSQTAYLLLSIAFFFLSLHVIRRRGLDHAIGALRLAALANIGLGLLDALGPDMLLEPFRTADYALLSEHAIGGLPRVIGGFSEASAFGAFSAALGGFFLVLGLLQQRGRDVALGALTLLLTLASLSSTAFLGVGLVGLLLGLWLARLFFARLEGRTVLVLLMSLSGLVFLLCLLFLAGPGLERAAEILDRLFFSKADSQSGLERGALAYYGFLAFLETHGLGAGVGSVRANGLGAALLASVGLPGAVLFLWFVLSSLGSAAAAGRARFAAAKAAQIAGLAHLGMMMASSFSVDPGLLFMLFAAIAVWARQPETVRAPSPPRAALAGAG